MIIFLAIMAAVFGTFVIGENNKEKRDAYSFCFAVSVLSGVAYKLIITIV